VKDDVTIHALLPRLTELAEVKDATSQRFGGAFQEYGPCAGSSDDDQWHGGDHPVHPARPRRPPPLAGQPRFCVAIGSWVAALRWVSCFAPSPPAPGSACPGGRFPSRPPNPSSLAHKGRPNSSTQRPSNISKSFVMVTSRWLNEIVSSPFPGGHSSPPGLPARKGIVARTGANALKSPPSPHRDNGCGKEMELEKGGGAGMAVHPEDRAPCGQTTDPARGKRDEVTSRRVVRKRVAPATGQSRFADLRKDTRIRVRQDQRRHMAVRVAAGKRVRPGGRHPIHGGQGNLSGPGMGQEQQEEKGRDGGDATPRTPHAAYLADPLADAMGIRAGNVWGRLPKNRTGTNPNPPIACTPEGPRWN